MKISFLQKACLFVFVICSWHSAQMVGNTEIDDALTVPAALTDAAQSASDASPACLETSIDRLPLYFIENRGQVDEQVDYYIKGADKTLYFTDNGITFKLREIGQSKNCGSGDDDPSHWAIRLVFQDSNPVKPEGVSQADATFSYFKGKPESWHAGVPTFRNLVYPDLWPGIDLVYSGTVNELKYEFIVKPGADPNQIRMAYKGVTALEVLDSGALEVTTPAGTLQDKAPYAYQRKSGETVDVSMQYELMERNKGDVFAYRFKVGEYDHDLPLVLDPAMFIYCGYIGGDLNDDCTGIATDAEGCAYVCGDTHSDELSFPVFTGPYLNHKGFQDAFVAKINAEGTELEYCGFIGSSVSESAKDIAVDSAGNAYVVGHVLDSGTGFPLIVGPSLVFGGGGTDTWVAKVNPQGTALLYCGYIGGDDEDRGAGIAVDGSGCAYVTGKTESDETTFPVAVGPDLIYGNVSNDAFIAKVNAQGTGLEYCGYVHGTEAPQRSECTSIDVDANGNAYVVGDEYITGAVGFVCKVNTTGAGLDYFTYISSPPGDGKAVTAWGVAVDTKGFAYVAGSTFKDESDFPVLVGPDLTFNGWLDTYVAKVNPQGDFVYCGFIGGDGWDSNSGIAVDNQGNAYVTGQTDSTETSMPVKGGPDLSFNGGSYDVFVAKVNADGTDLDYCGYLGGNNREFASDIAVDCFGHAYLTGDVKSSEYTFPVTVGPNLKYNTVTRNPDGFVARVALPLAAETHSDSAASLDEIRLDLNATVDNARRMYYMVGSLSGTSPGTPLPGGLVLPLNWDWYTNVVNSLLNSVFFEKFQGRLDDYGHSTATLRLPVISPVHIGQTMYYAYTLYNPIDFVSNPVAIDIVP